MYERTYHKEVLRTSPEKEIPTPRKRWKKFLIWVACLALIFFTGYALRHPSLQIQSVTVSETEALDPEEIRLFVFDTLKGNFLWIFPKTSTVLVQPETLAKKIQKAFPRIERISIARDSAQGLVVTISEYSEKYLWCTKEEDCFFMNSDGVVYTYAPSFSGTAYPKIYTGRAVEGLPFTGVDERQKSIVTGIFTGFEAIGFTPTKLFFTSEREARVVLLRGARSFDFIFDPTESVEDALQYFYSGIRTPPLSEKFADPTKTLEYIDVRFPNNIVYKFKE